MHGTLKYVDDEKIIVFGGNRDHKYRRNRIVYEDPQPGDEVEIIKNEDGEIEIYPIEQDDEPALEPIQYRKKQKTPPQKEQKEQEEDENEGEIDTESLRKHEMLGLILVLIPTLPTIIAGLTICVRTKDKFEKDGKDNLLSRLGIVMAIIDAILAILVIICLMTAKTGLKTLLFNNLTNTETESTSGNSEYNNDTDNSSSSSSSNTDSMFNFDSTSK